MHEQFPAPMYHIWHTCAKSVHPCAKSVHPCANSDTHVPITSTHVQNVLHMHEQNFVHSLLFAIKRAINSIVSSTKYRYRSRVLSRRVTNVQILFMHVQDVLHMGRSNWHMRVRIGTWVDRFGTCVSNMVHGCWKLFMHGFFTAKMLHERVFWAWKSKNNFWTLGAP